MELIQSSSSVFMIVGAVFFVWLLVVSLILLRAMRVYRHFTQGVSKKDLKSILTRIAEDLKQAGNGIRQLDQEFEELDREAKLHLQKVGFLRYNPFTDTGGNQSFCLALLDATNSGIVITSLHNRDQTRIYTKAIKNGKAVGYELSKEEQEAIKRALEKKKGVKK